ncbi:MAG TPA: ATP-binding protein [Waterburya sp.]|jgi:PAS domain S-box-containing protein
MNQVLLLLDHKENRRLMAEWIRVRYQVLLPQSDQVLDEPFDLCILDGSALNRLWRQVQARRETEQPLFLPFLFVTSNQDVGLMTRQLWQSVDELIAIPIEKVELQARVEILLRSRRLSIELAKANQQLRNEIAERHQAETELRHSEAQFRQFTEAAPDAIIITHKDGRIVLVNAQAEKMFGYKRENLIGLPIEKLLPDRFRKLHAQHRAQYNSNPQVRPMGVGLDLFARRQDGSEFPIDVSLSPIETKSGQLITSIIRDITERKQSEAEIRKALQKEQELNELKTRFVSMVSHEFRNPLTAILVSADLLEHYNQKLTEAKKSQYLYRIEQAAKQMTHLLDDVLVIGRTEAGKLEFHPEPLELEDFCLDLVEGIKLGTGHQHEIRFVSQFPCPVAYMDSNLLRHILTNLLSNAIKYSPEHKAVTFKLFCQDKDAIFHIQDEGIGISREDQQRLFESFHRGNNVGNISGTGLGLTIVKNAVDLHGGQITVESEVGVGTTFSVSIPLNNPDQFSI